MKPLLRAVWAGLLTGCGLATTGCGVEGTVSMQIEPPLPKIKSGNVAVLKPRIISNLPVDEAAHWASRLQNEIANRLGAAAAANGWDLTIVSPEGDLAELQRQHDLWIAGKVAPSVTRGALLADYDVFISGEVKLSVEERTESREVKRVGLPTGLSLGGIGGVLRTECVYVPIRCVSVSATLEMVTNMGTRPVSFVTEQFAPVRSEGGPGRFRLPFEQFKSIPPRDADVAQALEPVAPAFVDMLIPETRHLAIKLESCGEEPCKAGIGLMVGTSPGAGDSSVEPLATLERLYVQHRGCHRLRFAMALAYEQAGQWNKALAACTDAIALRDKTLDAEERRTDSYEMTIRRLRIRQQCANISDPTDRLAPMSPRPPSDSLNVDHVEPRSTRTISR